VFGTTIAPPEVQTKVPFLEAVTFKAGNVTVPDPAKLRLKGKVQTIVDPLLIKDDPEPSRSSPFTQVVFVHVISKPFVV